MGITFYFWIIRVVNSQLALYIHVICNSLDTPQKHIQTLSKMHHGIYIMGCIWQPFWILQERVGIFFYFWIIRLKTVSQHCPVKSDVTPFDTPWHTWNTPKTPHHMTITNFDYEGSYLPGVICYIIVKADLGRTPCRYLTSQVNRAYMPSIPVHQSQQTNLLWPMAPLGNRAEMPWIPLHQTWQTNLLWPKEPPWIEQRCLEYHYTKLGRQTFFGQKNPPCNRA